MALQMAEQWLKAGWGWNSFHEWQKPIIEHLCFGNDVLAILATSSGKSICFQIPALMRNGLTVVISPLISLMEDQVQLLVSKGLPARCLHSYQDQKQQNEVYDLLRQNKLKLLYISPERAVQDTQFGLTYRIGMLIIDEAHGISMDGHDFRPEYRMIGQLRQKLGYPFPVAAFTATATPCVQKDIAEQLHLSEKTFVSVGSVDRANLSYRFEKRFTPRQRFLSDQLEQVIQDHHQGQGGIVYCLSKKDVDNITTYLQAQGHRALPYHAGLDIKQRQDSQKAFLNQTCDIVVATNAFGMGINRPDIRFVIHCALPASFEHYQQESGRAGRDGKDASCYLFYGGNDLMIRKKMLEEQKTTNALQKLEIFWKAVNTNWCRHVQICDYFGQTYPKLSCETLCHHCLSSRTNSTLPSSIRPVELSGKDKSQNKRSTRRTLRSSQSILKDENPMLDQYAFKPRSSLNVVSFGLPITSTTTATDDITMNVEPSFASQEQAQLVWN